VIEAVRASWRSTGIGTDDCAAAAAGSVGCGAAADESGGGVVGQVSAPHVQQQLGKQKGVAAYAKYRGSVRVGGVEVLSEAGRSDEGMESGTWHVIVRVRSRSSSGAKLRTHSDAVYLKGGVMHRGGGLIKEGGEVGAIPVGDDVVLMLPPAPLVAAAPPIVLSQWPDLEQLLLPLYWIRPVRWSVRGGDNSSSSSAGGGGGNIGGDEGTSAGEDPRDGGVQEGTGVVANVGASADMVAAAASGGGGNGDEHMPGQLGEPGEDANGDDGATVEAGEVLQANDFMQHWLQTLLQVWLGWLSVLLAPARWYGNMVWALTESGFGLGLWFVELFVWWLLLPVRVVWWCFMLPVRAVQCLIMWVVAMVVRVLQLFGW
jgi:hypothetical protein